MVQTQEELNEEMKERAEYQTALLDMQFILSTKQGKNLFKYLFKNFEVGGLPDFGLSGDLLMDKIRSLRAGKALFELTSCANPEVASSILAQVEKEKYAKN